MKDDHIIDVDADAFSTDWIKTVGADAGVSAKDVVGLPAAQGVKKRIDAEGEQPMPSLAQAVEALYHPPHDPAD